MLGGFYMERVIAHSDLNNFYASVECLYRPELRNKPLVVGGDQEARHGIVLAKNQIAKAFGIKTGDVLWEAKRKCPDLVTVPANFDLYLKFSRLVRQIYEEYSDQVEPFGIDESWIDLTGSTTLFGSGQEIADKLRVRIYQELGVTVSVGVSFNKIFSKLGSDMKKPDATTVILKADFKQKVWPLPASELLYVGRATEKKLRNIGITTIGQLAKSEPSSLQNLLGVWGIMLYRFANGDDNSPVAKKGEEAYIKSVGNSTTTPRDLTTIEDVHAIFHMLSDSVAARLRGHGLKCTGVQISVRDKDLFSLERQAPLALPTYLSGEIAEKAIEIFKTKYKFTKPIRSLGVRGINLVPQNTAFQLDLFTDHNLRLKQEKMEKTVDEIRSRFGYHTIKKGVLLQDKTLTNIDAKTEHVIHPLGYVNGKIN